MNVSYPEQWLAALTQEISSAVGCESWDKGDILELKDGRRGLIVGGQYMGQHGLSNHWTWREILADGQLGPEENGYGWR